MAYYQFTAHRCVSLNNGSFLEHFLMQGTYDTLISDDISYNKAVSSIIKCLTEQNIITKDEAINIRFIRLD